MLESNEKKLKLYTSALLLTAMLASAGLTIHEKNIDHTEKVCTLSTILPNGIESHQIPAMKSDYEDKGISDVKISYGDLVQDVTVATVDIQEPIKCIVDGKISLLAPEGYYLSTDSNGKTIAIKDVYKTESRKYAEGLSSTWVDEDGISHSDDLVVKR